MRNRLSAHPGIWWGIVVFVAIVGLSQLWYVYQRHEATAYIASQTCIIGSSVDVIRPCNESGSVVLNRYLLGLGVHFSYGGVMASCNQYAADIISVPFKHFVFDKTNPSAESDSSCPVY